MTVLTRNRVFVASAMLIGLALFRTEHYYGTIYRGWDTQFYYSLAHSIVLDHDVDITNDLLETPYPSPFDPEGNGSWSDAPKRSWRGIPSKYPVGLSLIELPFFAAGHDARLVAEKLKGPINAPPGYSRIELWAVAGGLGLLCAWAIACLFELLAETFGTTAAIVGVIGSWLGTSLFYYSAVFPFMSQATSFSLLLFLMLRLRRFLATEALNPALAALGAMFAAVCLVRPQQAVVGLCLLPLVLRRVAERSARSWLPGAGAAVAVCALAMVTELWMNHTQFGVWTLSGYAVGHEGFDWLHPQLAYVLAESHRGLLFFSPIVIVAALGYFLGGSLIPTYVWPFVANAVLQLYLIAAWSSPEQGDAFGARMWTDHAAVVGFGLAAVFSVSSNRGRAAVVGATALCLSWTMFLLLRYVGYFKFWPLS